MDPSASSEPPILLTTPEPDPDEEQALPLAAPGGRLWVNDRNCFQIDEDLLLVPHGSTVSVDPPGIQVPGSEFVPTGSEVWGAGGHFSIDDVEEDSRFRALATPETEGVVFLWQLDVVSSSWPDSPAVTDEGSFFHGTKADLQVGDLLTAGFRSNYRPSVVMNHVYFTALLDGAGLAAELAAGDAEPRVYVVKPHGDWEDDPNVTDKKFPGNPTRSYRTSEPLMVVDEVRDWPRLSPEALADWRARLAKIESEKGEIIN